VAAKILFGHGPIVYGPVCFHCQQAVEKALKGFLTYKSIFFEKVHSLSYLLDLAQEREQGLEDFFEQVELLSPYAVEICYPGELLNVSKQDAIEAIEATEEIWNFVLERIPQLYHPLTNT